jgi:ankyrin repeat protein
MKIGSLPNGFVRSQIPSVAVIMLVVLAYFLVFGLLVAPSRRSNFESVNIFDAVKEDDLMTVKALLKDDPNLIVGKDKYGYTPLQWTALQGRTEMAELLLANKAEVNAKQQFGMTPLHLAVNRRFKELSELLLAHGGDVNARDNNGGTPLHLAAMQSNRELMELLLAHGAEANARNNKGDTPLHMAGLTEAVELLLAHGADVNAKNDRGDTPLHYAMLSGNKDVAEFLSKHGGHE